MWHPLRLLSAETFAEAIFMKLLAEWCSLKMLKVPGNRRVTTSLLIIYST